MKITCSLVKAEDGAILMIALIFVGILALLGATATLITTTDTKIGANYKSGEQALYVAEAGAQEARQRLRIGVTGAITDAHTDNTQWRAYIGTDPKSQKKGYESSNANHIRTASLQTDLDYTVMIKHVDDGAGNVLYWGDDDGDGTWTRNTTAGENIYLITAYGNADGAAKSVQLEVTRVPPITIKAALYSGTSSNIQGNVAVDGNDSCGGTALPGIATPQGKVSDTDPVDAPAGAVTGSEGVDPDVSYGVSPINTQSIATSLKKSADFSYNVNSATQTASTTPGPGDGWGTPDLAAVPPTCSSCNIVHYDTNGTSLTLSGQVSGCGILLVEGDLDISGGFEWYGTVVVTGSFQFTGGAGAKNIMGAVLSGESTDGDFVGGNVDINYCSTATESQTNNHALTILSWKQVLAE